MLLTEFRERGTWFIPGLENKVVFSGDIIYSPVKGIKLELIPIPKSSDPDFFQISKDLTKCKFMYGKLMTGEFVTLYDTFALQMPIFPYKSYKYHANFGFIGEDYLKDDELNFKSFLLKLNILTSWFFLKGLNLKIRPPFKIKEVGFENEELTFELDFAIFELGNFWKQSFSHQYFRVEAETYIRFHYKENANLQSLLKTVYQIQILLSLIGGKNFYPSSLGAETSTGKKVDILYSFYVGEDYNQEVHWNRFLFNFRMISDFSKILKNYFNSLKEIEIVYDLFYEYRFRRKILEEEFLNIVRALEVYHRIKFGGSVLPDDIFSVLLKEIESTIQIKIRELKIQNIDQDQLRNLIPRYANEPNLNKRLKELYSFLKNIGFVKNLLGGNKKKVKNFLYKVSLSRNYYTHFNPDLKDKALRGIDLYWTNKKLGAFLEILLLKEIGFQDTEIDSAVSQNLDYTQLLH